MQVKCEEVSMFMSTIMCIFIVLSWTNYQNPESLISPGIMNFVACLTAEKQIFRLKPCNL